MDKMMTSGTVYSAREIVNVILPGTGYRGEGNHFFRPARGRVLDYVRAVIADAIEEEAGRGGWASRPHEVTVRPGVERGTYAFTVWG